MVPKSCESRPVSHGRCVGCGRGKGRGDQPNLHSYFPHSPWRRARVHTTRDFQRTTSVSPLPQRTIFQRPTLSSPIGALRQVKPVSLRITLRGLLIPAILTITLSLDINTLVLGPQMGLALMFQRYPFGRQYRHNN